jgi:hypothetical protein
VYRGLSVDTQALIGTASVPTVVSPLLWLAKVCGRSHDGLRGFRVWVQGSRGERDGGRGVEFALAT